LTAESTELKQLRAGLAAWNEGDYERSISYARPDVIWRVEPFFPDMEPVYEGHDGLRRFYETFNEAWDDNSLEIVRVIDERPGQIYVELRFWAKARGGLEFEAPFHQIYRYDDEGLLAEFHGFADESDARRTAGLADD
jgi:ketosteroid isomerase-like protein